MKEIHQAESIPQEVIDIVNHDTFISSLPTTEELASVSGGVTHLVYRITSEEDKYYLKIRKDRFVQIPEITCNPADIAIEHRALTTFHQVSPENFPRVLSFNQDKFYMVLSDAIPNGEKLETLFLEDEVTPRMLFNLGGTLRRIHDRSMTFTQGLRTDDDAARYEELLEHRFGYRHHLVLDELVDQLRKQGSRQLVLGDPSPKNIGANNDGELFMFFDLETAHKGDTVFDYGYLLGHVAIHTFTSPATAVEAIKSYTKGYGEHTFNEETVKRIALGIMLYRLDSIIPYPLRLDTEERTRTQQRIEEVLAYNLGYANWPEVIKMLQYE